MVQEKLTTLRMIMGLIKPTSGEIEAFGQNLLQNKKKFIHVLDLLLKIQDFIKI